ncbi:hypothetical protein GPX89_26490 [Nocardia sp. ET3-3]|uniref:SCP2 domain-containing protein n=1 Tax=Nocardia terrae TaxID=2675851 RepID=A0A7K1V2W5_9NOCA|nr:SCP2 sterol-binding domain-containing protein [Nocardia terrae]MVU80789.1 hypothetical protein [Nocardia terrae]
MAIFKSAEGMYEHFVPFLEALVKDPVVGPKFVAANTSFRVNYTDPEAVMVLDATNDPAVNTVGEGAKVAVVEVELSMSADDGHKFWLGELNLPVALARRKVKIQGPVTKLLGMLPAIAPAYGKYREYVQENPVEAA